MCTSLASLVLLLAVFVWGCDCLEDCSTYMSALEEALYQTGDNIFQLNHVFYPPSMRTSQFLTVRYTFLNETGRDDGCNVTYIWAIGGFLFFQPPTLFQLTSLFFNYPSNNLTDLYLELPQECRSIVQQSNGVCSCTHDTERLDILTQQLDVYAKVTERGELNREHTFARALCADQLEAIYHSGDNPAFVFIMVCSTIVLPIFAFILLFSAVRKMDDALVNSFTHTASHGSIVALVLTGTIVTVAILGMNILACLVVIRESHEFSRFIEGYSINLYIVFGTLACNILFSLPLLLCLLYITVCFNARGVLRRLCCNVVCSLHPCFGRFMAFLIGDYVFEKITTLSGNGIVSLMFPLMMATPILCLSSHVGYILLAWLTDPSRCTASFLLYYALIFYFFFAFKKFYNAHSKVKMKLSSKLSRKQAESNVEEGRGGGGGGVANGTVNKGGGMAGDSEFKMASHDNARSGSNVCASCHGTVVGPSNAQRINTQMLCFLLFYGLIITGIAVIFVLLFLLLPISSMSLLTYILQLLQLILVLVSTQYAYRVFLGSGFSLEGTLRRFQEVYAAQGRSASLGAIMRRRHENLSDVAGEFAAELTDVVIHRTTCACGRETNHEKES